MRLTDKTECWLVWERAPDAETGGRPYLRAVDLTEDLAKRHRMAVINEARLKGRQTMVMIEKSQVNHLYGESMTKGYDGLREAFKRGKADYDKARAAAGSTAPDPTIKYR